MYWLIKNKSDESTVYVSAFPDIMFTSDRKKALKMDKLTAMDAIHILMNMQKSSSFTYPDDYTFECVKEDAEQSR